MPLYLVRHAPVTLESTCYGQIDVPTRIPAPRALTILQAHLPRQTEFTRVWSSPLARCRELAQAYTNDVTAEPRLMEAHFGQWEGLPWDEIHAQYPSQMAAWGEHWLENGPPGGESALDVQGRFESWVSSLESGTHLAFTHAGVVRAARVTLKGQTWADAIAKSVDHLGVERFQLPTDTPWRTPIEM